MKNKGFTLIELVVVLATVFAIFMMVGLFFYRFHLISSLGLTIKDVFLLKLLIG